MASSPGLQGISAEDCSEQKKARIFRKQHRPVVQGIIGGKMRDYLLDQKSLMFECLKRESVECLLLDHMERRSDNHKILYSLVLFEKWLRCM
jgi:hypothetical protein